MSRKVAIVTIDAEGRDKGKVFELTEMPASKSEKWAIRAFLALGKSGIEIPENIAQLGLAAVAMLGLKAFAGMPFADAESLMDEAFECVRIVPSPGFPPRYLVEDDIEEISTRFRIRMELFTLHTGFSRADVKSKLGASAEGVAAAA